MEIFLGIVVVVSVIIFGALLSIGNERQRRAIDALREQIVNWAVQDLLVKREKIKREIKIDDPITWLNRVVMKVYGEDLDLKLLEIVENPTVLVCVSEDGRQVFISPYSVKKLIEIKKGNFGELKVKHVLQTLPKGTKEIELSTLNSGIYFDLEFENAWQKLTENSTSTNKCFVYLPVG